MRIDTTIKIAPREYVAIPQPERAKRDLSRSIGFSLQNGKEASQYKKTKNIVNNRRKAAAAIL
jgi:hypothetical protein